MKYMLSIPLFDDFAPAYQDDYLVVDRSSLAEVQAVASVLTAKLEENAKKGIRPYIAGEINISTLEEWIEDHSGLEGWMNPVEISLTR